MSDWKQTSPEAMANEAERVDALRREQALKDQRRADQLRLRLVEHYGAYPAQTLERLRWESNVRSALYVQKAAEPNSGWEPETVFSLVVLDAQAYAQEQRNLAGQQQADENAALQEQRDRQLGLVLGLGLGALVVYEVRSSAERRGLEPPSIVFYPLAMAVGGYLGVRIGPAGLHALTSLTQLRQPMRRSFGYAPSYEQPAQAYPALPFAQAQAPAASNVIPFRREGA